ncbi:aspartate carbamoyltransferase [Ruminococcaceae bacterium OttesenSCG-928-O06]|nr:aspartate carbamoyltransferase [Ruminococcaceae bacterium OttesenSCG-928-O06]
MRHLISPGDLSRAETDRILDLADEIIAAPDEYSAKCRGKKIATLFYEPSTRTRLSFEAAMLELGGGVLGFSSADSSSATKGESVADTVRTVENFADIIAIRHPKEGAAAVAARYAAIPVINAGDGGHLHPTQTLTDLLTIRSLRAHHSLDGFTIGLCGDLMFGRTVHSLVKALMERDGVRFVLISPKELRLPAYLLDELRERAIPFEEVEHLDAVMPSLDVLYMTRVQKERFFNEQDYVRLRDSYILDAEKMRLAKEDMMVLHPLPRVNEIAAEVDADARAAYFKQMWYGKYARMALILALLGLCPVLGQPA